MDEEGIPTEGKWQAPTGLENYFKPSSSSSSREGTPCRVCGDVATGRHYGAIACNGCKGFFRRTVRRGYKYECRFNSNCDISKHNRAVCRFCRYTRCVNAGMRDDQVQNERDVIGKRNRTNSISTNGNARQATLKRHQSNEDDGSPKRYSPDLPPVISDDPWAQPSTILDALLNCESSIHSLRDTVIKQTGDVEYTTAPEEEHPCSSTGSRTATVNDIFKSLHSQLLLVIEWAKTLPPFQQLSPDDQTALLKNFAPQHIVLCVAYRSKEAADFLRLLNDSYIPRPQKNGTEVKYRPSSEFFLRDCERVMDQLVAPMRFLKMDDAEFVALKACILFNPVAKSLSPAAVMQILETRRSIFASLEHYVKKNKPHDLTRIGDLTFFVLSPLNSLANSISEDILVSKLSGVARIDVLMEELILADAGDASCRAELMTPMHGEEKYEQYQDHPGSLADHMHQPHTYDHYSNGMSHNGMDQYENPSRSTSPVLGMLGAGNLMWSSSLLSDSNDLYQPNDSSVELDLMQC